MADFFFFNEARFVCKQTPSDGPSPEETGPSLTPWNAPAQEVPWPTCLSHRGVTAAKGAHEHRWLLAFPTPSQTR